MRNDLAHLETPGMQRPLVVHLTYSLDVGGLETLLVDCINRMPPERYRHAVVCLTRYTDFAKRITQPGVELYALGKPPGLGLGTHLQFWRLMRRLRPAILHTYNLSALEYNFSAALAGVPVRIHAEHGRDAGDPHGLNPKHNFLRRRLAPFIDCFIPVSEDLHRWLGETVRIPQAKTLFIKNGVDTERFAAAASLAANPASPWGPDDIVIGTVARVQDVKNHRGLVAAFARLRELVPEQCERLRLSIVGDGPLMGAVREQVASLGLQDAVWLPGARADVAALLHGFSLFALPSLAEGTPVSMLEAMACGLPVVASNVGGIPEVVTDGLEGSLVPPQDTEALAQALASYVRDPALRRQRGEAARARVEAAFSMRAMLAEYGKLYDRLCHQKIRQPA
ncbi:TIGR03088 family PEP-CTERM/XrtA system glycosyltransferase [Massilia sp. BSC265]|uniref:TIGR03088 family PEP-CTERM/XrtA system glycosyltransferase n=1 Tax=Massilia sp. BSC265 TaxID=1549812 RepID=UPI0004E8FB5A|nr:TIGR03088 family PEP-CTERM/XrtA system glycosyltransferase [Massilia sp. BSC265]KFI05142.1 glycosyl transferase group 1 protein [Massilia sp. BSC265]